MRKSDDDDARPPAPEADGAAVVDQWAGWEAWMAAHLNLQRQSICAEVESALNALLDVIERMSSRNIKRERKIARLEAKLEALVAKSADSDGDDVLPNWRSPRRAA
jgi:hypothetical protein